MLAPPALQVFLLPCVVRIRKINRYSVFLPTFTQSQLNKFS
nr:MAG TPA: hypothetical protein [Caudoviricetes sp.]